MLHCNMADAEGRLELEYVLAALWLARRDGDLARLARLGHCEVQRWARARGDQTLSACARALLTDCPYRSREEFICAIDRVIAQVEHAHVQLIAHDRTGLSL